MCLLLLGRDGVTGNLNDDQHTVRVVRIAMIMLRESDADVRDVMPRMQVGHTRFDICSPWWRDVCVYPFDL
jgi:hypothetical protein